ncbi:MAG: hypothetical protein K1X28_04390 [Parachlamydiales bacterium]|nr:hypothetical protein [Parachlamydiales bacterium]
MSVQLTNQISEYALSTAIGAGTGALAASLATTSLPTVGPLKGAVFGAVSYISSKLLNTLGAKLFHLADPMASNAAKTLVFALAFFGSVAAGWWALSLSGVALTLNQLVSLELLSILCSIPMALITSCFQPREARLA